MSMYGMACLGVHSGHYENKDCLHSLQKSFHQMHVCRRKIGRTTSVSDFEGHTLKSYCFCDMVKEIAGLLSVSDLLPGSDSHDDEDDDSDDDKNDDEHYKAQDDVDGSDDEAPESVGFSDSRTTVLAQLRSAMKQVDDEKQKLKDKRKKKQVMFKEQKEKKMKYTEQEKLPDDILESIDDVIPKNNKHKKKLLKQQKSKKQKNKDLTKNNVQPEQEKKGQKFRSHPVGSLRDDYIPLVDEASGVTVTEVRQFEKQQKSLAQKAADFRNSRLNSSDIPRESNRARLLKLEKKRQRLMS